MCIRDRTNTINRFNEEVMNNREQFNATNQLVISQANAQWRRQIATADTAAVNQANQINAAAVLGVSEQAYENLWQYFADTMEFAWTSADNDADRLNKLAVAQFNAGAAMDLASLKEEYNNSAAVGGFLMDMFEIGLSTGFKFGF